MQALHENVCHILPEKRGKWPPSYLTYFWALRSSSRARRQNTMSRSTQANTADVYCHDKQARRKYIYIFNNNNKKKVFALVETQWVGFRNTLTCCIEFIHCSVFAPPEVQSQTQRNSNVCYAPCSYVQTHWSNNRQKPLWWPRDPLGARARATPSPCRVRSPSLQTSQADKVREWDNPLCGQWPQNTSQRDTVLFRRACHQQPVQLLQDLYIHIYFWTNLCSVAGHSWTLPLIATLDKPFEKPTRMVRSTFFF